MSTNAINETKRENSIHNIKSDLTYDIPDVIKRENKQEKDYTLVFCIRQNPETNSKEVMLGMKKRGFGEGKYNGFGGKLEPNETVEEAAVRELEEESGVITKVNSLKKKGYLVFNMEKSNKLMKVHVYIVTEFTGTGIETDEMRPVWVDMNDMPTMYDKMWKDDPYWFHYIISNKKFVGRFDYSSDDNITSYELKEVEVEVDT